MKFVADYKCTYTRISEFRLEKKAREKASRREIESLVEATTWTDIPHACMRNSIEIPSESERGNRAGGMEILDTAGSRDSNEAEASQF